MGRNSNNFSLSGRWERDTFAPLGPTHERPAPRTWSPHMAAYVREGLM